MPTYKKEYPTLVENIMTECDIYSVSGRKFHTERAIWDTGADTTIISSRIVKELNLQPYKAGGISGIGGATGSNVYLVH
ncbi:MAG: aspartyl protease family protein, partial [Prevotella sp.]|nr:aspartyl protease family protein [Prevotella sp.]